MAPENSSPEVQAQWSFSTGTITWIKCLTQWYYYVGSSEVNLDFFLNYFISLYFIKHSATNKNFADFAGKSANVENNM